MFGVSFKIHTEKYSSYFRLYEYQIVEMQHEYELLLEDKVYLIKLIISELKQTSYLKT